MKITVKDCVNIGRATRNERVDDDVGFVAADLLWGRHSSTRGSRVSAWSKPNNLQFTS